MVRKSREAMGLSSFLSSWEGADFTPLTQSAPSAIKWFGCITRKRGDGICSRTPVPARVHYTKGRATARITQQK